jgi:hypothetical protein
VPSTHFTWPDGTYWVINHCCEFIFGGDDVAHLTAQEIGERVMSLIPRLHRVGPYWGDWQRNQLKHTGGIGKPTLEELEAWVDKEEERLAKREIARQRSPQIRKEIRDNYDRYFMALGRRDGFHCQQCQTTYDLTIDHVVAVINGGINDLDKMQLLCGGCNSRKSDK